MNTSYFSKITLLTITIFGCTGILWSNCFAQQSAEKEETFNPHHQLAFLIGHAHVFEGRDAEGKKKALSLPSWGIDYTYQFHPKWGVGIHTDIIIEKFKVEKRMESGSEGEVLERSYPIAPALIGVYKPARHWSFLLGIGGEFAKEENYTLTRAGVEYGSELPKGWEVFGSLGYDFRWNAYDSWAIGIGIAKKLGKK